MAWLMYKESDTYKYRGKKVSGFENNLRPKINLSWGMEALEYAPPKQQTIRQSIPKPSSFGSIYKRSEQEELNKILKKYEGNQSYGRKKQQKIEEQKQSNFQTFERLGTQSSSDKIRYLENSLLPISRRDTMGIILNHDIGSEYDPKQSRISRRSSSGNKKNQSNVYLGEEQNMFSPKEQIERDFHQRLLEQYKYEDDRKSRKLSQIQI